jgi:AcrR family transcriptional regulator
MSVPVGQHPLPREVMAEHQRRRALRAAIPVFAERGYPAATVDDLVTAAQMGVGSFYSFFNGKEECLLAAFEDVRVRSRSAVAEAVGKDVEWPRQVCSGLRAILDFIVAEPAAARIVLIEIQTAGPRGLDLYAEMLAEVADVLARGRDLAAPSRRLPASLEQTTVSGIAWLLHRRLILEEVDTIGSLFDELANLILEPYLGEAKARRMAAAATPAQA